MDQTTESQQTNNIVEKEVGNISVKLVYDGMQSQVFVYQNGLLIYKNAKLF